MSAPRHFVGYFWRVCRVGLAGALQDACVPEGGHRQSPAPMARARGAAGCGAGTGYSETDTEDTHVCGPPRPGSVPVCPSWEVRLKEGNILHKNDRHREMTDGRDHMPVMDTNRGKETSSYSLHTTDRGPRSAFPAASVLRLPHLPPSLLPRNPSLRCHSLPSSDQNSSDQNRSPSHKLKSLLTAAIKQLN